METLRGIVVVLHLLSFGALFGAWLIEVVDTRQRITRTMQWGMVAALATGLTLAAPWGLDGDLDYVKIGTKLVVLVVIGALLGIGGSRQRREGTSPSILFWSVGALTVLNTGIAVLV
ncbi:Fe-S protein [uncultured Arthrobacter sp.]|uniref:Fe-S protein n=1 Tax=uncultured Arthrobacter sp. TaxID=114050 RepID=UPI0026302210|nr:Fe-S protein [uncultured Arthrobacter sp.]